MKFIIRFGYEASLQSVTFETEEKRDETFQKIWGADWEQPFLIEARGVGHKTDIIINLPKVCHMSCINEE